jgi:hypothetical protein
VVHLQGALVLMGPAALAAAPGASVNPVVHRAADRGAVAAAVGNHLFAALLAEGIEALAAELQQRVALAIAQRVAADQALVAIAIGGDGVEGEPGPACAFQDLGAMSCAGAGAWGHPGGGVTGVALARGGTQASQAAMSASDRLHPAPLPGVPTSSGGKVRV